MAHQYFSKEIYNVNYFLGVIENYYVKDYLLIESKWKFVSLSKYYNEHLTLYVFARLNFP